MSTLDSWHPDSKDLANLAKERLSLKETQRILDHCRECRECTDKLLETVWSQSIVGERRAVNKRNWMPAATLALFIAGAILAAYWR